MPKIDETLKQVHSGILTSDPEATKSLSKTTAQMTIGLTSSIISEMAKKRSNEIKKLQDEVAYAQTLQKSMKDTLLQGYFPYPILSLTFIF